MLLFLNHHLVARHKNLIRDDSGPELLKHSRINFICQVKAISLALLILLMEGEGLFVSLRARHRCFLVLEAALLVFLKDTTIKGLSSRPRNIVGLEVHLD